MAGGWQSGGEWWGFLLGVFRVCMKGGVEEVHACKVEDRAQRTCGRGTHTAYGV